MAFCEQGVAMLSSVLRSQIAIQVNIEIMRAFIAVRQIVIRRDEAKQGLERELNEKYVELKQSIEKLKQENEIKNALLEVRLSLRGYFKE